MADPKKEPIVVKIPETKVEEPKSIPSSPVPGKIHVDLYLKSKGVPLYERGGKRAFAVVKEKEFASDKEFDELFKSY